MTPLQQRLRQPQTFFAAAAALAVLVVLLKAVLDGRGGAENFITNGNDDIMRLLSVRDLIAGQGWYDVAQYRLLPPEGVDLHWSRYLDAAIAAVILPLAQLMPMPRAEMLAAAIWPTLVMLLLLAVTGFGVRRLFGPVAGGIALLTCIFWPLIGDVHMRAGNLDHHNLQLLTMSVLGFALVWPDRPLRAGMAGGLAAALSLAIGLETLPFVIAAGLCVYLRALLNKELRNLAGFCAALCLGALMLFAGQTAPGAWGLRVCDQLGLPVLGLIGVACVASLAPMALLPRLPALWVAPLLTALLTGLGLIMIWPLLAGCVAGPYGALPPTLQETISTRIIEAQPALTYAQATPLPALVFTLPALLALVCGGAMFWRGAPTALTAEQRQALGFLLALCAFGLAMTLFQMRTVIMTAAVAPAIIGAFAAFGLRSYLAERSLGRGVMLLALTLAMVSPTAVLQPLAPLLRSAEPAETRAATRNCRSYAALATLNALPESRVLTTARLGPALLFATHHTGLAAPYHRSPAALANGILPFEMEEEALRDHLRKDRAELLLLCPAQRHDSAFLTGLLAGQPADWLTPAPIASDALRLYAVQN